MPRVDRLALVALFVLHCLAATSFETGDTGSAFFESGGAGSDCGASCDAEATFLRHSLLQVPTHGRGRGRAVASSGSAVEALRAQRASLLRELDALGVGRRAPGKAPGKPETASVVAATRAATETAAAGRTETDIVAAATRAATEIAALGTGAHELADGVPSAVEDVEEDFAANRSRVGHRIMQGWAAEAGQLTAVVPRDVVSLLASVSASRDGLELYLFLILLGLISVIGLCIFCYCGLNFTNPLSQSLNALRISLLHPEHPDSGVMVDSTWMVLLELYPGKTGFYSFRTRKEALQFYNRTASVTPRILFRPVDDGHIEVQAAGPWPLSLDSLRKVSRAQVSNVIRGKWMVIFKSASFRPSRIYAFQHKNHAQHFLQNLSFVSGIIIDPKGKEVEQKGAVTGFHVLEEIRHDAGVPQRGFFSCGSGAQRTKSEAEKRPQVF